jgi:hypothetical protein
VQAEVGNHHTKEVAVATVVELIRLSSVIKEPLWAIKEWVEAEEARLAEWLSLMILVTSAKRQDIGQAAALIGIRKIVASYLNALTVEKWDILRLNANNHQRCQRVEEVEAEVATVVDMVTIVVAEEASAKVTDTQMAFIIDLINYTSKRHIIIVIILYLVF